MTSIPMDKNTTTMKVSKKNRDELAKLVKFNESLDDVLTRILKERKS